MDLKVLRCRDYFQAQKFLECLLLSGDSEEGKRRLSPPLFGRGPQPLGPDFSRAGFSEECQEGRE